MADTNLRFRLRGGLAAEWALINPVLLEREPGVETDTQAFKLGDGIRPWNDLPYTGRNIATVLTEAQAATDAKLTPVIDRVSALESVPPGSFDDTQLRADMAAADQQILTDAKAYADVNGGGGGAAYTLTVGTVTEGPAQVVITGESPNQVVNFVVPRGQTGLTGRGITSVTDPSSTGTATVTYTDGATSSLPLPRGPQGLQGVQGAAGLQGVAGERGPQGLQGETGRGVTSITDPGSTGTATITYSDNTTAPLPLPRGLQGEQGVQGVQGAAGADGRGISSVADTDGDGTATVTYTDGTTAALPLPRGLKGDRGDQGPIGATGDPGRGITSVTDTDGNGSATIAYSDGTTAALPLPRGLQGEQGIQGIQGVQGVAGADGRGITSVTDTDGNGTATVTYTDGTTANLPLPRGLQGEQGIQGIQGTAGVKGDKGDPGRGITSLTDTDADGIATVTYSDGATASLALPRGPQGEMGTGLEITGSVATTNDLNTITPAPVKNDAYVVNDTGLLHIYDGAGWSTGIPFKGDKGDQGIQGTQGLKGDPGRGVTSITDDNADGTAVITYSDGATANLPLPRGLKGDQGAQGIQGVQGTAGRGISSIADTDADGTATITYSDNTTSQLPLPRGLKGDKGDQGIQGIQGVQGVAGADGRSVSSIQDTDGDGTATITYSDNTTAALPLPRGLQGEQGIQGQAGTNGADGRGFTPRGAWAASTAYAVDNIVTANGSTFRVTTAHTSGTTAPTATTPGVNYELWAAKGDKGDKGDQGTAGTAATVTAGTTSTVTAGTAASVTNTGTTSAAIFDFTIPAGPKGDKGDAGTTEWTGITGKPTTYPPDAHSHAYADITAKPTTFPPSSHTHLPTEISGTGTIPAAAVPLATATAQGGISAANFSRINNAVSTATVSRVVIRDASGRAQFADPSALADAATKNYVDTGLATKSATTHSHAWVDITAKPTTFPPDAHTHAQTDVTGLGDALAGKASTAQAVPTGGTAGQVLAKNTATNYDAAWITPPSGVTDHGALTGLADDDHTIYALADGSRGSFASTTHTHGWTTITDKPSTFAPSAHTHAQTDVSGLGDALAGKSDTTHTHSYTTLTDIPTEFTPAAHTHTDATGTTSGFMPATDKTKLDGAVAAATASRLVARDAAGRAQFANPAAAADAAPKGYVDARAVPTGGTTGQLLSKASATNNDLRWISPPASPAAVLLTTDPGNTNVGQWTKLATVRFSAQWQNISAKLLLLSRDGTSDENSTAEIIWRVKQNDPLGGVLDDNAVLASIAAHNMVNIAPNGLRTVLDTYTTTETFVSLWMRVDKNWERIEAFQQAITGQHASLTYHSAQPFQVDAPTGLAFWEGNTSTTMEWVGTQAEYNALTSYNPDVTYYIVG